MKKTLVIAGVISTSIVTANAVTVNYDTAVSWSSGVIEQALTKSGFIGSSGANRDVRLTRNRILEELLKKKSFSLRTATQVCLDKCNLSDFLKNGRGASGKKCPELCKGFTDALVSVNNSYKPTGTGLVGLRQKVSDGVYKIYSKDKKYYALTIKDCSTLNKYKHVCGEAKDEIYPTAVVFIAQSNTPIALLTYYTINDDLPTVCVNDKYGKQNNKYLGFTVRGIRYGWSSTGCGIIVEPTVGAELYYDWSKYNQYW